ncbi:sialate O-acetylesterase [Termitidicoccus mucosus]|uniref:sialate O-acetylesterase n=1 Tax=Termitidicoccus mucosus TaxID=1184151 RepID=UPI003183E654
MMARLYCFLIIMLSAGPLGGRAAAAVRLPALLSDGAVLQRGCPIPLWGTAAAGEKITVTFHGQRKEAEADGSGLWRVVLEPEAASDMPSELIVSGENIVRVADILVGDVWLCAGQSNMQLELKKIRDAAKEIAAANHPSIRQFAIARKVSDEPLQDVSGTWKPCTPATAGEFSAVAYFFARSLQEHIRVPVGLINCAWGGTTIEGWLDGASGRLGSAAYTRVVTRWNTGAQDGRKFTPSGIHNAMVKPLYPAAILGVVWYQGESNARQLGEYAELFVEMINRWREGFRQPRLPFYFVQLPGYNNKEDNTGMAWARLREAQATALALPATSMVVTIDLGEHDRIHPVKNKQMIGWRLAAQALVKTYGAQGEVSGPVFDGIEAEEGQGLRVKFTHATGLVLNGRGGFEVAGDDRIFHPAEAKVSGSDVIVTTRAVKKPLAVRYAWQNSPSAPLFNAAGFRSAGISPSHK